MNDAAPVVGWMVFITFDASDVTIFCFSEAVFCEVVCCTLRSGGFYNKSFLYAHTLDSIYTAVSRCCGVVPQRLQSNVTGV